MNQGAVSEGSYEFNQAQNEVITGLWKGMKFVGIFLAVSGVFAIAGGVAAIIAKQIGPGLASAGPGIMLLALGMRAVRGGRSFRDVVESTGRDITNLMTALQELRVFFKILTIYAVIYLAFLFIGIGVGVAGVLANR
jgi:hypothetical protein